MWIFLAIAAGSFQAIRNTLAYSVSDKLSALTNSWSRFAFNLPFSGIVVLILISATNMPIYDLRYLLFCTLGGVTQLTANVLLILAFRYGKLANSVFLKGTEAAFAAIIGMVYFSEWINIYGATGIGLITFGVIWLNIYGQGWRAWRGLIKFKKSAILALMSAVVLGVTPFLIKRATLHLPDIQNFDMSIIESAFHTVFTVTLIEVLILSVIIFVFDAKSFSQIKNHIGKLSVMGFVAFAGSACWFTASALTNVAYVRAVGLVELLFTSMISVWRFKESDVLQKLPAYFVLAFGVLIVILANLLAGLT